MSKSPDLLPDFALIAPVFPELVLQKKNQAELVRHSLVRLSPEHGEVIDLVYYHGKSVREAAEIVGVAAATVKTRMFYARKKLAELFEAA